MSDKLFTIGAIAGAHGIKGDIKVFPFTDDTKRFEHLETVFLETAGELSEYEIKQVRYHKKFVMLKLVGINTMNDALALKGAHVKIDEKFALPLDEDEYYVRDLFGMDVYTIDGEFLGIITDVLKTGANDVYEVDKKLYIPAIKDCIIDVNTDDRKMTVHLLEGLRE